ncbi:hypothetical protein FRC08_014041 [Ceratobasidium sp. 394]|nr:hypothetical protein FRC08_014041 [Ceratobasidium sp. 394]KAG9099123.1 hypothetical protein FS749_002083 [Ceratobasidium sp. UAMH 11750]
MPQTRSRSAAMAGVASVDDPAPRKRKPSPRAPTPVAESTSSKAPVLVSTRFNPEERDMLDADLVLVTQDLVYFYAHHATLLRGSSNSFTSLLREPPANINAEIDVFQPMLVSDLALVPTVVAIEYPSDVLNLVLHIIYKFSVQSYRTAPITLRAATTALFELGYNLEHVFTHYSEPYMLYLQGAVVEPLSMYALAACYSLESLAVAVSTFTLEVPLSDISDELAQQMGPIYLRRLFFLHLGRTAALKRLLYPPPPSHTPSPALNCDEETRQKIPRIWALACSSVVIQSHPNNLAKVFAPLSAQLPCVKCRQALHGRAMTLVNEWSKIKATI